MKEILEFLNGGVFFLATEEDDQPRVRPLGFVMEYGGKLAFCTANTKDMYRQMQANPKVELSGVSQDMRTLRICGEVSFVADRAAKEKALEVMPDLKKMYSVDDGIFTIFQLDRGIATFQTMSGEKKSVMLGEREGIPV